LTPFKGEESIISEKVDEVTAKESVEPMSQDKSSDHDDDDDNDDDKTSKSLVDELNGNETLKYQFLSNMALDIFLSPFYEGEQGIPILLFIQDGINIYGYETNTGLKILIGTSNEINSSFQIIFKKLHKLYLNLIINPFQNNDLSKLKINKNTMTIKINQIIKEWDMKYNDEK